MGEVIHLPLQREWERRLCFNCDNALVGVKGVYCQFYHEEIFNERTAEACSEFVL